MDADDILDQEADARAEQALEAILGELLKND